jgi:hypothetical protein
MTGPYFESWEHENLVKFAKDAYAKLQKQEEELQRLRSQWPFPKSERFELWEASKLPEPEQAEKQGSYWEEEARRYAGNADFWREKAKRQPLPAHEIVTMYEESPTSDSDMIAFARAIERKHGIGGGE